ncbi:Teneurin-2, partial [Ophiophagus hannah]
MSSFNYNKGQNPALEDHNIDGIPISLQVKKWQKCYIHKNILKKEILLFEVHCSSAELNPFHFNHVSIRIMDVKDRRHRSLTRGRCGKECRYTSSSLDSEDCRVPTQKSYSSSETLKAYDHDTRMHYGNRVTDLVHRESDEFPRQ